MNEDPPSGLEPEEELGAAVGIIIAAVAGFAVWALGALVAWAW